MSRLIDAEKLKETLLKFNYTTAHNQIFRYIDEQPTAFDTEKVIEQLDNVLQDLNVIEVISHIDFDSTIQTSLENFLNAFKSEIMRIVKNNACIDELLKDKE